MNNPCQNGGTCLEVAVGSHVCTCPPEFSGAQCETSINPCDKSPCKNNATCISNGVGANGNNSGIDDSFDCEC